jgi:dimethylhistidine N-methyltransferase
MYISALLKNRTYENKSGENFNSVFFQDILRGLTANPKYLESKYFYDAEGDKIFQKIMCCEEYYLTKCELEILSHQSHLIAKYLSMGTGSRLSSPNDFDVVELGPGDASKSVYLLETLHESKIDFTYYPIDISQDSIFYLENVLSKNLPEINIIGLNGEYIAMLDHVNELSTKRKVVMFMGASIGNFLPEEAIDFFICLRQKLHPGDMLLTGFDLKKNPKIILDAYNDRQGITRSFNFNLLQRINDTFDADFNLSRFDHFPVYDPETGSCKSYIISLEEQAVHIGDNIIIPFSENEFILMEVSQKYTIEQVSQLAVSSGFKPVHNFYDSKKWFVDALWIKE